jgi:hypothetical protein
MCGCNGTYSTGERQRKLAITALTKNPKVTLLTWDDDNDGCIFVEANGRNRTLYLNNTGIKAVREMGILE